MFYVKDITSKQEKQNSMNIAMFENDIIIKLIKYYNNYNPEYQLIVCDEMVRDYNRITNQNKTNKNFVKQVKKLCLNNVITEGMTNENYEYSSRIGE